MNQAEIIIYKYAQNADFQIEVRVEDETVWLNRQQMDDLFSRDIKTIGKHINNALREELRSIPVIAKFATTATDGKTYQVEHYSLDMILSVGYRVKSQRGVQFRRWANEVLHLLAKRNSGVNATIFTGNITNQLQTDLNKHNQQYPKIELKHFTKSHDRFLIIDQKDLYHIGASLKDLGKRWFAFSKINLNPMDIINKLNRSLQ